MDPAYDDRGDTSGSVPPTTRVDSPPRERDPRDSLPPRDYDRGSRSPIPPPRRESAGPPSRPHFAPVDPPKTDVLGVFGLSIRTTEDALEREFSRFGKVEKVTIVYDQRSDRSRGFGFIQMASVEDAERCIENLNGLDLNGRRIRVDFSVTTRPHNPTPGEYMGAKKRDDDRHRGGRSDRYDRYEGGGGRYGGSDRYDRYDGGRSGRYDERDRRRDDYGRDDRRGYDRDDYGRSRPAPYRSPRGAEPYRSPRRDRRYSPSPPPRRRRSYSRSPAHSVPKDYDDAAADTNPGLAVRW